MTRLTLQPVANAVYGTSPVSNWTVDSRRSRSSQASREAVGNQPRPLCSWYYRRRLRSFEGPASGTGTGQLSAMRASVHVTPPNQRIQKLSTHWLHCIYITVDLAEMRTTLRTDESELHQRTATISPYRGEMVAVRSDES